MGITATTGVMAKARGFGDGLIPTLVGLRSINPGDDAPEGTPGTGEANCRNCHGSGQNEIGDCYNCGGRGLVIQAIGG